jgi:pyruvate,water dikinase
MLGFRGASRYYSDEFADAFGLECAAMKHARDVLGLTNIELMIPFVRTEEELRRVLALMASHGLRRGDGAGDGEAAVAAAANGGDGAPKGMRIHMMCEIPANALLADRFLALCDGFSIGACVHFARCMHALSHSALQGACSCADAASSACVLTLLPCVAGRQGATT